MADDLSQKLELARARERTARARTARLRRSLDRSNRKTQRKLKHTLGGAILERAESGRGDQMVAGFRRWLDRYLARPQDRRVLRDTPFALDTQEDGHGNT